MNVLLGTTSAFAFHNGELLSNFISLRCALALDRGVFASGDCLCSSVTVSLSSNEGFTTDQRLCVLDNLPSDVDVSQSV
jgi:hypothetical protein